MNHRFIEPILAVIALVAFSSMAAFDARAESLPAKRGSTLSVVEDTAINPMTGKLLSEEDLNRRLSVEKLRTQIAGERLKQVQISAESDRARAEGARSNRDPRGAVEARNMPPSAVPVAARPAVLPVERAAVSAALSTAVATAPRPPTGTILIGADQLQPQARYAGPVMEVNYVDRQDHAAVQHPTRNGPPLGPVLGPPVGLPSMPGAAQSAIPLTVR